MIKSVKTLVFLTISSCFFHDAVAQLKLPGTNHIGNDIRKVIEDYPNRFINIMGEILVQNTQSTDYLCNFNVNGAEEATVTRYSSKKTICSWQAVMLTTEDFEKARQKFKSLYNQLQNLSVQVPGIGSCKLKAEYMAPKEEQKFTSVIFSFDPSNDTLTKLKVELTMSFYQPMEWKVRVQVYDREREDKERGTIEE